MRSWSKAWRLSPAERTALAQALVLLPLIAVALRIMGFRRCQTLFGRLAPLATEAAETNDVTILRQARAVTRMVDVAARRGLFRATCLPRSLALWCMLRRRRIDGDLCIGIRKEADRMGAHAWVELGGAVLNDNEDVRERFTAFGRTILPAGRDTL